MPAIEGTASKVEAGAGAGSAAWATVTSPSANSAPHSVAFHQILEINLNDFIVSPRCAGIE
jgi:hypothetical protein